MTLIDALSISAQEKLSWYELAPIIASCAGLLLSILYGQFEISMGYLVLMIGTTHGLWLWKAVLYKIGVRA